MPVTPALRIHRKLESDLIPWNRLQEVLASRHRLGISTAGRLASDLRERTECLFSLGTLHEQPLSSQENGAVRSLVELVGADEVTVSSSRDFFTGPLRLRLTRCTHLRPGLRQDSAGSAESCLILECAGRSLCARQRIGAYLLFGALVLAASATYAILFGLLLYAFSVFYVFLQMPGDVTLAAVRQLPVGLALLAMLVGLAGLSGRAFVNLVGLLRGRATGQRPASSEDCSEAPRQERPPAVMGEE